MIGVVNRRIYRYYRCSSTLSLNFHGKKCPGGIRIEEAEQQVMTNIENVFLDPARLAVYVTHQQQESAAESERLNQDLGNYRAALSGCDEEWARLLEAFTHKIVSLADLDAYKQKLDQRREEIILHIQQCEERLASLEVQEEQIRSLIAYVARIRNEQLAAAAHAAVELYPTWDMEPQLVESIKSAAEKWEKQGQQFHAKWKTMPTEQRQRIESQWRKRQVREKLRSMTTSEKQQLFDTLGLRVEWTRGQPLAIALNIPLSDEITSLSKRATMNM